ncbi:DinB family protein [Fuerstiella marisgermanici]|uniref:DinB family protein n=1 Tax=Fuerstiella marisgermanici TaxID=1891926 RepID=A0A1P8WKX5_9PLAN|nr:DinB family protein [Fuerstiella marisgermanici]APZ94710.1 hypothetical protein Fuma_04349 [Fuerstiella marisgermanici]
MSRSLGFTISDSLQLSLGYAERLLKDVQADQFARFGSPGGQIVESNHAAFVYGHLSLYGPIMLKDLGHDAPATPDAFQDVFSKNAQCVDDPRGTIYPPMEQVTEFFFTGYRTVLEALQATSDEALQQPNPLGGPMTEKFPTLGSMHAFYAGGHMMMHLGQMSAWRRMQGIGAA